jgi:hypothetical protein
VGIKDFPLKGKLLDDHKLKIKIHHKALTSCLHLPFEELNIPILILINNDLSPHDDDVDDYL